MAGKPEDSDRMWLKYMYHISMEYVGLCEQALQPMLLLSNDALCLIYGINVLRKGCPGQSPFQLLPTRPALPVDLNTTHKDLRCMLTDGMKAANLGGKNGMFSINSSALV